MVTVMEERQRSRRWVVARPRAASPTVAKKELRRKVERKKRRDPFRFIWLHLFCLEGQRSTFSSPGITRSSGVLHVTPKNGY